MKSALAITSAVASAFVGGCSTNKAHQADENAQICANSDGVRVEDEHCDKRKTPRVAGFYSWYYITRGGSVPAMGQNISGGSFTPSAGVKYAKSGATAPGAERGGFGRSGHTFVAVHS